MLFTEDRGGLLQHHAARAEAHGANNVAIVFRGGQRRRAWAGIEIDFLENGQAIFIRHAQVEEKNIGLELGEELDAIRAILGLPTMVISSSASRSFSGHRERSRGHRLVVPVSAVSFWPISTEAELDR